MKLTGKSLVIVIVLASAVILSAVLGGWNVEKLTSDKCVPCGDGWCSEPKLYRKCKSFSPNGYVELVPKTDYNGNVLSYSFKNAQVQSLGNKCEDIGMFQWGDTRCGNS